MQKIILGALAACLLPAVSPAQIVEYYHPPQYKSVEGPERSAIPFGVCDQDKKKRMFRYQQVHDNLLPKSEILRSFAVRRDGTTPYDYAWCSVDMELFFSTSPVSAATASTNFAANHGKDLKTLISRTTVYFPTSLHLSGLPERMDFYLPCS